METQERRNAKRAGGYRKGGIHNLHFLQNTPPVSPVSVSGVIERNKSFHITSHPIRAEAYLRVGSVFCRCSRSQMIPIKHSKRMREKKWK